VETVLHSDQIYTLFCVKWLFLWTWEVFFMTLFDRYKY
jgi:hypothetical protein